jgi:hypothetical protein
MANPKRRLTAAGVTRETLEQTPQKALQLLMGIGMRPTVRALLAKKGYDKSEHQRGWDLIAKAANRLVDERVTDEDVRSAAAELDNWDEPNLRLIRAALTRHPEVRTRVLQGIEPVAGLEAVLNVEKILQRLDAVAGTAEGDRALATLAKRGLDEAERERVAELVTLAKSARATATVTPDDDDAYEQALLELRDWYSEWAEIARLVVKRRDHLIRLGLAERRVGEGAEEDVTNPGGPFQPENPPTPPVTG